MTHGKVHHTEVDEDVLKDARVRIDRLIAWNNG